MQVRARLLTICLLLLASLAGRAQAQTFVTSAGLVDWAHPERLKVGTWTRYRVQFNQGPVQRQFLQTVAIVGFETVDKEPCVWIETKFEPLSGDAIQYTRVLMGLGISKVDSVRGDYNKLLPEYLRRVLKVDRPGAPVQEVEFPHVARGQGKPLGNSATALQSRSDTLPPTDVVTDAGKFHCTPARLTRVGRFLIPQPDGSRKYHRQEEEQINFLADEVPITRQVRQTYRASYLDGMVPADQPDSYDPPGTPVVSRREAVLEAFGTDYKSAFPKKFTTVPMNIPTKVLQQ